MMPVFINKAKIPRQPGVYIYKDSREKVLYVGKAIDLYHRVVSYFQKYHPDPKIQNLVSKVVKVDTIVVESELEALILEANLIKKYLPGFNIKLTDDKDYLYIAVTKGDFPKVVTARKKELGGLKKYWGPFPSSNTVRITLKALRKVFPWCSKPSKQLKLNVHSRNECSKTLLEWNNYKACFYYHLGLCPGSCAGVISKEEYTKIINRFTKFMDGKKGELVRELTTEMLEYSQNQEFEKAAQVKKTLTGISYLTQSNRTRLYLENPNFLQEETEIALKKLQQDLKLAKLPERIECYDISNIQGKEATGSMIVLTRGEIDKSQYRRFKISPATAGPNDVGMLKEMVKRRLNHPEWPMPDLIIVDGGRGQARAVNFQFLIFNFQFPIFGLAKRMEWLYPSEGEAIKLPRNSLSLKLLQKLRDEAHRFAVSYHRKLRDRIVISNKQ